MASAIDPTEALDAAATLAAFRRLVRELEEGKTKRNSFQPWEMELLLDIEACDLPRTRRGALLRRYRRAVERQLEKGVPHLLKLSDYLRRSAS
jgi:hypothetical protein